MSDNDPFDVCGVPPKKPQGTGASETEAHGQAALLLVESLIHALVAKDVISVAEAIEVVNIATDTKEEIGFETGEPSADLHASLMLLEAIERSLLNDYKPPT